MAKSEKYETNRNRLNGGSRRANVDCSGCSQGTVAGPWISDTAEEIEHPTVPLGINRMAIPRAAIFLSLSMVALIFLSTVIVGYSAWKFLEMNQDAFDATDKSLIRDPETDRWYWEATLLYDTCNPRLDDWNWPDSSLIRMIFSYCREKSVVTGSTKGKETGPHWRSTTAGTNPSIWSSRS